jgi:hypothetical protein
MTAAEATALRARAAKCRRLAKGVMSQDVERSLTTLAAEYERQAEEVEPAAADAPGPQPPQAR